MNSSINKLCQYLILIFKGVIWLLMKSLVSPIHGYMIEDKIYSVGEGIDIYEKYENNILINLKIHDLLQMMDFVLIPTNQLLHEHVDDYNDESDVEWVYTNLRIEESGYKMDKVLTYDLEDKIYLVGTLDSTRILSTFESIESSSESDESETSEYYSESEIIDKFIIDNIQPILTHIDIKENKLDDGSSVPDIYEYFKDNITNHWFFYPKNEIIEIINMYAITYIILYSVVI